MQVIKTLNTPPPPEKLRTELLKIALKNVVARHGVPRELLGLQVAYGTAESQPIVHARLVARCSDPCLLANLFDIQKEFAREVIAIDPDSRNWLTGISWHLHKDELDEDTDMPSTDFWERMMAERRLRGIRSGALKRSREELDSEFSVFSRTGAFQIAGDFQDTNPDL
jgi:hypothetical protein